MDESRGSDYNRSTHRIEDRGSMRDNSKRDFFFNMVLTTFKQPAHKQEDKNKKTTNEL